MNYTIAIEHLFPNCNINKDFLIVDDGSGAYIKEWNRMEAQPSEDELQKAYDDAVTKKASDRIAVSNKVQTLMDKLGLVEEDILLLAKVIRSKDIGDK
jgi:hypothetical protein